MARLACNTIVVIQTRAFREAGCNAHSLYVTSMHELHCNQARHQQSLNLIKNGGAECAACRCKWGLTIPRHAGKIMRVIIHVAHVMHFYTSSV